MEFNHNLDEMQSINAGRTQQLLRTTADILERITAQGDLIQSSFSITHEWLVEPVLDALNFDQASRSQYIGSLSHCELYAAGDHVASIVTYPLAHHFNPHCMENHTSVHADDIRQRYGHPQPVIFSNGLQWQVHQKNQEVINFNVEETGQFRDLFVLGAKNG